MTSSNYDYVELLVFSLFLNLFELFNLLLKTFLLEKIITHYNFFRAKVWEHSFKKISRLKRLGSLTENHSFCFE